MTKVNDLEETIIHHYPIKDLRTRVYMNIESSFIDYYNDAIERYEDNLELQKAIRMSRNANHVVMNSVLRL